jgi:fermentation-respiration switch protein FrsA (DUF1100 family)
VTRLVALLSLLGLPVLFVAGVAAMVARQSYRLTNPPGYVHPSPGALTRDGLPPPFAADPRREYGLDYQEVAFPTESGATLRGWLVPGAAGPDGAAPQLGIVAAHARGGDRRSYLDQLPLFHDLGYTTLLFDFREHGVSDGAGRGMSLGYREAQDVSAAVRFLKQATGVRQVVVVGHSLGGSAVILAAAADPAIDAVIADSSLASFEQYIYDNTAVFARRRPVLRSLPPPPHLWSRLVVAFTAWRIGVPHLEAPVDVIGRISPRPVLLMAGTGDGAVEWAHTQRLYDRAGPPKELWLAEGADHNALHLKYPEEYRRRVSAFLKRVATGV